MPSKPKSLLDMSLVKRTFRPEQIQDLTGFVLSRDAVGHAELEDGLRAITRRFERFAIKGRALDLYTNGRVHLLNNKETVRVPTLLPGWRMGGDRGPMAYVNVTQYAPPGGAGQMDVRKLFGFLVFGAILVDVYSSWDSVSSSMQVAKCGSVVYSRMMHKVIDRITGIGMDRMRSDQVKFVLAKYFLVNMLGRPANETSDAIASAATLGTVANVVADFEVQVAQQIGAATQKELYAAGILEFIDALSKSAPWMSRLTTRAFIQNYSSMYSPPGLLAAEDASYFLAILGTHQAGAEIVSGFSFDPVYGKEGDDALDELARLLR